jgi:hypothetical protein
MKIKKNAVSTLFLETFANPNSLVRDRPKSKNPKIDSPYSIQYTKPTFKK